MVGFTRNEEWLASSDFGFSYTNCFKRSDFWHAEIPLLKFSCMVGGLLSHFCFQWFLIPIQKEHIILNWSNYVWDIDVVFMNEGGLQTDDKTRVSLEESFIEECQSFFF